MEQHSEKHRRTFWKVLIDQAEAEAYDKIKTILRGQGIKAYGVVYRWFIDVSGSQTKRGS